MPEDPLVVVPIHALDPGLVPPRRIRVGDAAADLPARHETTIEAGQRALIPTGFSIAIPEGAFGLVLPRSGLALNHGITVLNAPGLIDSGYRGEVKVILLNTSTDAYTVSRGDRVAQLLVLPFAGFSLLPSLELPPAPDDRGSQGFGSSG